MKEMDTIREMMEGSKEDQILAVKLAITEGIDLKCLMDGEILFSATFPKFCIMWYVSVQWGLSIDSRTEVEYRLYQLVVNVPGESEFYYTAKGDEKLKLSRVLCGESSDEMDLNKLLKKLLLENEKQQL